MLLRRGSPMAVPPRVRWVRGSFPRANNPPFALRSGGEGDVQDFVAVAAARHLDLGDVADLLAEQPLAPRAGGEDLVVVVVLVTGADQLVLLFLARLEVLDADAGTEDDGVGGQFAPVDDLGPGQLVLEGLDP